MPEIPEISSLLQAFSKAPLDAPWPESRHPSASAAIMVDGRLLHQSAHGHAPSGEEVGASALYDLASVTKIAATTLSIARLISQGELSLETQVKRVLPRFQDGTGAPTTIRALLAHRSGLAAWSPLFFESIGREECASIFPGTEPQTAGGECVQAFESSRSAALDALYRISPGDEKRRVYSDLGFILLGQIIERISGQDLTDFVQRELYDPISASLGTPLTLAFRPLTLAFRPHSLTSAPASSDVLILPTGERRPRPPAPGQEPIFAGSVQTLIDTQSPRLDPGEVDDDNAYALGGVAGHAGLFGTAESLAHLGAWILQELSGAETLGMGETLRRFVQPDLHVAGLPRALGFDLPSGLHSSVGKRLGQGPKGAIGHLGYTGCSLWLDLDRGISAALCTNRVLPGRRHIAPIRALRPAFHDTVFEACQGI